MVLDSNTVGGTQMLTWLASYPKSGNTWVRAFLATFLSDAREPLDLKKMYEFTESESHFRHFAAVAGKPQDQLTAQDIDALRPQVQQHLAASIRRLRVIKTHNARMVVNDNPLICSEYTKRAVYVVRNPLDVVDSYADHANLSIDKAIIEMNDRNQALGGVKSVIARQYLGSWSQHVTSWTQQSEFPVLLLRYEDLHAAPRVWFQKLLEFLGVEVDEAQLTRAVELSSFDVLRECEATDGFAETSSVARSGRFFRQGTSGRWPQVLSREQAAVVIAHHGSTMRSIGYDIPDLDQFYPSI